MSYTLRLDPKRTRLQLNEIVTRTDLIGAMHEMEVYERTLDRMPDRIADLTLLTNRELDYALVSHVAGARRERRFPTTFRTAIVAPTQVTYGFARMFQALKDNPQVEVRIFESAPAAEAWLDTAP